MRHRRGHGGVALGDRGVHRLGDGAVARVALAGGAQLGEVHRLAGVEVEHVADAVAEAERVRRGLGVAGVAQALVLAARAVQRALVERRRSRPRRPPRGPRRRGRASAPATGRSASGGAAGRGTRRSRRRSRSGSAAPRTRGPGGGDGSCARRRGRRASRRALAGSSAATAASVRSSGAPAASNSSAASRRSSSPSTWTSRTDERSSASSSRSRPSRSVQRRSAARRSLEVVDPDVAAAGALDAGDEARDHGLDRLEQPLAAHARLGQRVREQVQDQLLVGLAGRVDAHVRQRRGGQQPAQQVQRLGLDRAAADRLGLAGRGRERRVHPRGHARQRLPSRRRTARPSPRAYSGPSSASR